MSLNPFYLLKKTTLLFMLLTTITFAGERNPEYYYDWEGDRPDGCTSVTVGRKATVSGCVTTSHTCDSHRTRAWLDIVSSQKHDKNSTVTMVKRAGDNKQAMPAYKHVATGDIPQVEHTHGFINTAYPCMNDKQLAIGESTFGGRSTLRSDSGLIDCQQLVQLMLERCETAREAIELAGDLTKKYGYIDGGECLTIADKKEVWHLEIVGPGKGNVGSIWVAQRVPDDHVSVNANASRIRQIDLDNTDFFMASENIFKVAQDSGWWNPEDSAFEFCYAYDPGGRHSLASRRREWRALKLMAPSLHIHPDDKDYPFSVKPDSLVTLEKLVQIFQDYYEGTNYNFVKNITDTDKEGKTIISPFANPFMPYDMNRIFKINGGWGALGERTIARWYTMYATITQSRENVPDEIGGLVWFAFDNVATSVYVPLYCSILDVPASYKARGRETGYSRDCAWWGFNRMSTLAAQRWGDMRHDVRNVFDPMQAEMFADQAKVEQQALALYQKNPKQAVKFLTQYSMQWADKSVQACWKLGDQLWTKYDEKF